MRRYSSRRCLALVAFAVLNALDILTTHVGLASGIAEGNPVPAAILASGGIAAFVLVKVGIFILIGAAPLLLPRMPRLWLAVPASSAILALAVASNLSLIS